MPHRMVQLKDGRTVMIMCAQDVVDIIRQCCGDDLATYLGDYLREAEENEAYIEYLEGGE